MNVSLEALGIDKLSAAERLVLIHQIWTTLEAEPEATSLTETQRSELEKRLADHRANPNDVVAWEEVEATLLTAKE